MLAVVALLAAVVPAGSAAVGGSGPLSGPLSGVTAEAAAAASGRRVEMADRGTETGKVFANPDGTYTLEQGVIPNRVRRGGSWVPVDNTLQAKSDGTVAPVASTTPLVFSAGGSTPFARFGGSDRQLTLSWPGALPRPVLDGDSATYPEVLPGVDLRVTAKPQGFSHVLVVRTPQAARDPRLAKVTFGLETKGITLQAGPDRTLTASDPAGATVFQAPPPAMWDANPDRGKVTMPVTVTDRELTLVPDQKLLTDPTARFPIEIDPDWSSGRTAWALVYEQHPDDHYWFGDSDNIAKVGYSGNWEPKTVTVRSYFQFDVWALAGKDIVAAEFNVYNNYSASCTGIGTTANQTTPISGSTSWNNSGGWVRGLGTYGGAYGRSACPARSIGFNVRDAVADPRDGQVTVQLSTDQGTQDAWRKFDPNSPQLIVTYNDLPYQPWGLSIHGKACNGVDPYIATTTPVLRAGAGDPNGTVQAEFEWYVRNGNFINNYLTPGQPDGTEFSMTIPAGSYANGGGIAWRVRGWDGRAYGPWSIWCGATMDLDKPDKPPTVASGHYPENGEAGSPGMTGEFTFGANGVGDVGEFKYRLSGHEEKSVPAVNGTATAYVTPPTADPYTLEVTSVDKAGNRATQENTKKYQFRVGLPTPPSGHWPLDGYHLSTVAPDVSASRRNATLNEIGPALWTKGRINDALKLNGSSGYAATQQPAVYTAASFTVSAWVKLDRATDLWYSAVSQQGVNVPGFALQYAGNTRTWSFSMLTDDVLNPGIEQAVDTIPPVVGQWTHLTGVYNSTEKKMSLYVNGRAAGSTVRAGKNWHTNGGLQIGRGMWNGVAGDYWPGAIDDVKVYSRALPDIAVAGPTEVDKAAIQPTIQEAVFALDERTGTTSTDVSGHYRESTLVNGPTWTAGKVGAGAVRFDGKDDHLSTSAPVLRTDNSYTVSAWARPDGDKPVQGALVSQDGANGASGFYLLYRSDMNAWVFSTPTTDAAQPGSLYVKDSAPPQIGWSHMTGVYDASVPEIRLYVNGAMVGRTAVPGGIKWNAPGNLQIGRAKWTGLQTDFWKGWIDEVHAYTGVRTDQEIRDAFLNPATDRGRPDALGRYVNFEGDHFTTNGLVPNGYRREGPLGWLAPAGTPGTKVIYSCITGTDEFTSAQADCEGWRKLATVGSLYTNPPSGLPSHALYRCVTTNGKDHFVSTQSDCEGQKIEGLLGYSLPYQMLYRSVQRDGRVDNSSDTGLAPAGYVTERPLGGLATSQLPGTRALMQCGANGERFSSVLANCENQTVQGQIGWIWTTPPSNLDTVQLWRCTGPGGEHFDSTDPDCEGKEPNVLLGYVLRGITV
ncbi:MAG: LamG domain-containing protein [Kibdelosporangium sp.]